MAQAEGFTAKDFLKLDEAHQKFWIEGAVDMMGLVAANTNNHQQGKCIMKWYYGDENAERNGLIIASMRKYEDVPPNAIMLALAERACGTIKN